MSESLLQKALTENPDAEVWEWHGEHEGRPYERTLILEPENGTLRVAIELMRQMLGELGYVRAI